MKSTKSIWHLSSVPFFMSLLQFSSAGCFQRRCWRRTGNQCLILPRMSSISSMGKHWPGTVWAPLPLMSTISTSLLTDCLITTWNMCCSGSVFSSLLCCLWCRYWNFCCFFTLKRYVVLNRNHVNRRMYILQMKRYSLSKKGGTWWTLLVFF